MEDVKPSPLLFLELHNELVTADGRNPNEALDELQSLGYETLALDGSSLDRSVILQTSIIRIIAKRSAFEGSSKRVYALVATCFVWLTFSNIS